MSCPLSSMLMQFFLPLHDVRDMRKVCVDVAMCLVPDSDCLT